MSGKCDAVTALCTFVDVARKFYVLPMPVDIPFVLKGDVL